MQDLDASCTPPIAPRSALDRMPPTAGWWTSRGPLLTAHVVESVVRWVDRMVGIDFDRCPVLYEQSPPSSCWSVCSGLGRERSHGLGAFSEHWWCPIPLVLIALGPAGWSPSGTARG